MTICLCQNLKGESWVVFKINEMLFPCLDNLAFFVSYLLQNHKRGLRSWKIGQFELKNRVGISMMMSQQKSQFHFHFYNNKQTRSISMLVAIFLFVTVACFSTHFPTLNINGYSIIRNDRNRYGGGVACYVKNDLCFNTKIFFPQFNWTCIFWNSHPKS